MKLRKLVSMREALEDPAYFGGLLPGESWRPWRVLLIAIVGEALTDEERITFESLTGRAREPLELVEEFWAVIGRRGGKTRAMAVLAAFIAACCDHRHILAPGERGVLPILAASTLQAGQAFNFVAGIFSAAPNLKPLIENVTADTLSLSTGVDIQVRPASFRTIRGITAVAAIGDEIAFWRSEDSANPDTEILRALLPTLATTGGMLACISSPHAKRGKLYATFKRHYGPAGHPLIVVAKAPSRTMNPTLPQSVIDRALEEDPEAASAEWDAEFRGDIETFVSREAIDAATVPGRIELPPVAGESYVAFVDPSGGASDSMTLGIAHAEGDVAILDAVREVRPPFSPDAVVSDFVDLLNRYGVHEVTGDRCGGAFVGEQFDPARHDIPRKRTLEDATFTASCCHSQQQRDRVARYPSIAARLGGLERRTARGGRDLIDHAPNSTDDLSMPPPARSSSRRASATDDFDIRTFVKAYSPTGNVGPYPTGIHKCAQIADGLQGLLGDATTSATARGAPHADRFISWKRLCRRARGR